MSKRSLGRILWIDDDPSRRKLAKKLEPQVGQVEAWHPESLRQSTRDFSDLGKMLIGSRYDMIVLDYDLASDQNDAGEHYAGRAPRLLGILRDAATRLPQVLSIPVYLISGHFADDHLDWHYIDLPSFDGIITEEDFSKRSFAKRLNAEALEYRRIRDILSNDEQKRINAEVALKLTLPPESARGHFLEAAAWFLRRPALAPLSDESMWRNQQGYYTLAARSAATTLEFVRWLRFGLLTLPGPLLDTRRAAVALGMTERAFARHKMRFAAAQYKGLFSATTGSIPLWWRSELESLVSKFAGPSTAAPTLAALSRAVFKLNKADTAWCAVARHRGIDVEADILAYPVNIDHRQSDAEDSCQPVARSNATPVEDADLPAPFERVYRFQLTKSNDQTEKA